MLVRAKLSLPTILVLSWFLCFASHQVDCQTTNSQPPRDPNCENTKCSCCLDTVKCLPDGQCGGQCKDGYFGGKCLNTCPGKCISCTDPYNPTNIPSLWGVANCTQCEDGYYSTSQLFQCQFGCPDACQTCNSKTECTSCKDGYFQEGSTCTPCKIGCDSCTSKNDCKACKGGYYILGGPANKLNCVNCSNGCSNQCDSVLGNCTCKSEYAESKCDKCADGRYGGDCSQYCQLPCSTCTSRSDCLSCVNGYYWDGNKCQPCQTGCAQCSSSNDCSQCMTGYYRSGTDCERCTYGCNYQCNEEDGTCSSCRSGFTGDKCYTCIDGRYGEYCNDICRSPCKACTSNTDCKSCVTGYVLHGTTCSQCKPGCAECSTYDNCIRCMDRYYSYGTECVACSRGCSNQCNDGTGTCSCKYGFDGDKCDRCLAHFDGTDCDRCMKNYHGTSCDRICPPNCEQNECSRDNGTCNRGCIENYTGSKCNDCIVGRYANDCNAACPENCNGSCNRSSGYCEQCKSHFVGSKCDECNVGKHGQDCSLNCSSSCMGNKCDRGTSTCSSCPDGSYGDQCNIPCPSKCLQKTCDRNTGACIGGCTSGYSGDMCCLNGSDCKICSTTSDCSECLPGKYGGKCDFECPTNCADNICDKGNGTCHRCIDGFQGESCDGALKAVDDEGGPPGAAIGGGVAGTIVVIVVVVVLIIIFRRRRASDKNRDISNGTAAALPDEGVYVNESAIRSGTKNQKGKESAIRNDKIASSQRKEMWPPPPFKPSSRKEQPFEGSLIPDVQSEDEAMPENDYYNSGDVEQKGIPINELAAYIDQNDAAFFESEFTRLPQGLIKPTEEAMKERNLGKNRYNAIYPYDETRVTLQGPGSDFINACYIEGFRKRREYIASLGPIAKATEDYQTFWRMVWQEKTEKIVMVTNLMENGGMKCEKYWPDVNKFEQYGDVTVTCHSQDAYAEYTVRSFTVKKGKEKQRSLHHIHYTAWPDKGVPDDVTSLIEFRNKVNSTKVKLGGPVIVHCSAGVGRTGTYIALDILTYKGEKTGYVDIFHCVEKLRQQRTIMVQTAGQYEYVHRALAHTLTLGSEAIPADKFQNYASSIPDTMFDKLSHCKEKVSNEDKEAFVTNKALTHLNRKGADIPGDSNRPRLYMGRTTEDNNYINAVYVNSFKVKNKFIMTQTPLPTTVNDFLTLVVQENCYCVVSMDPPGVSDKSIGTYLPADNQELCVEPFQLKTTKVVSEGSFTQRTLTITSTLMGYTAHRTVQHFQYTRWPGSSKAPTASDEFLQLVKEVQKASDEAPSSSTVIVHCRTGSERSGLLCVVVSLLQKMEIEHEVSVINTVRQVKFRRPKAIPNEEQFTFCHTCLASYLKTFDIYSNFS